jgi:hypothetical protein
MASKAYRRELVGRRAVGRVVNGDAGRVRVEKDAMVFVQHLWVLIDKLRLRGPDGRTKHLNEAVGVWRTFRDHTVCALLFERVQKAIVDHRLARVEGERALDRFQAVLKAYRQRNLSNATCDKTIVMQTLSFGRVTCRILCGWLNSRQSNRILLPFGSRGCETMFNGSDSYGLSLPVRC